MSFGQAISTVFRKYATFDGRASRAEFWYFTLFTVLVSVALAIITGRDNGMIANLANLVFLLPSLAVGVRRLHDTTRTGWYILFALIPVVGIILLIVWWAQAGPTEPNEYGDSPLTS
jgi:uncharacterized membrane protein YhaH (DUF805 family)